MKKYKCLNPNKSCIETGAFEYFPIIESMKIPERYKTTLTKSNKNKFKKKINSFFKDSKFINYTKSSSEEWYPDYTNPLTFSECWDLDDDKTVISSVSMEYTSFYLDINQTKYTLTRKGLYYKKNSLEKFLFKKLD